MDNWVPTSERLPDKKGIYLARFSDGRYKILGFSENLMKTEPDNFMADVPGWFMEDADYGIFEVRNVTHWMPLPEPPEEVSET